MVLWYWHTKFITGRGAYFMGIGKHFPIYDPKTEKPTVLEFGSWFCYGCNQKRKTISYPFTDTITEPCKKCGSTVVYKIE